MAAANERAAGERQKNTFEAERAFFGFSPVEFVDDVCEPAPQLVREGCGELGRYLEGLAPRPDAPSVEHGTAKLQKALVKVFDCNTDKFELYLCQNIFPVAPKLVYSLELRRARGAAPGAAPSGGADGLPDADALAAAAAAALPVRG